MRHKSRYYACDIKLPDIGGGSYALSKLKLAP